MSGLLNHSDRLRVATDFKALKNMRIPGCFEEPLFLVFIDQIQCLIYVYVNVYVCKYFNKLVSLLQINMKL